MTKILYVEDNHIAVSLFKRQLQAFGAQVIAAQTGEEAIAQVQTERPDVIVSDIQLADMDGIQLMAHLRDDPMMACVPVIIVTNHISSRTRRYAEQMGCSAYLMKPISSGALMNVIQQVTHPR